MSRNSWNVIHESSTTRLLGILTSRSGPKKRGLYIAQRFLIFLPLDGRSSKRLNPGCTAEPEHLMFLPLDGRSSKRLNPGCTAEPEHLMFLPLDDSSSKRLNPRCTAVHLIFLPLDGSSSERLKLCCTVQLKPETVCADCGSVCREGVESG